MDGGFHVGGRRILHAGCGADSLPEWMSGDEVRLDIDPSVSPDIVAAMDDLGDIGTFGAVFTKHSLEHLSSQGAVRALKEFHRVLDDGGFVVVVVPDIEGVLPTKDVLFIASCGPITGLDLYYGHQEFVESNPHMAHKTGFTAQTLEAAMKAAGFSKVTTKRLNDYNLLGVAVK